MTDREKAVVMAYTGTVMLAGDKLGIFYDYVAELMGRRLNTHEIGILAENIKHRATPDFIRLCEITDSPRQPTHCIDTDKLDGFKIPVKSEFARWNAAYTRGWNQCIDNLKDKAHKEYCRRCPAARTDAKEGRPLTAGTARRDAVELVERLSRKAKAALANAENKQNNEEERRNLAKKIAALDWLHELAAGTEGNT